MSLRKRKITLLTHPLNANQYRWGAAFAWFIASTLILSSFYWQERLDIGIRQYLVEQSVQATDRINLDLLDLFQEDYEFLDDTEALPLVDEHLRQRVTLRVNQSLLKLNLGVQGFGVLITRSGDILGYPDSRLLQTNVSDVHVEHSLLGTLVKQFNMGQLMTFLHPITGQEQWMVLSYIRRLDANLGLVIDAEELRNTKVLLNWLWDVVRFLFCAGIILMLASWRFPLNIDHIIRRQFVVLSLCLFSLLVILWEQALDDIPLNEGETLLVDRESTELAWRRADLGSHSEFDSFTRPVQLTIQYIHVHDSGEIRISGNIWVAGHQSRSPPLQIQDAMESAWQLQRQIRDKQLWHFVAQLKQSLVHHSFPFDKDVLTLTLLPVVDDQDTILAPLFSAYNNMAPQALPGIASGFDSIGGWQIEQTYFSYQVEQAFTESLFFGLKYNIAIQRSLIGALVSHVMPLCVVSFLAFCMLLLWTKDSKKQSVWGFSTAVELEYSASLFFILVISHVALRDSLNVQGIVFIEYFYFLSYLQIILIAVGSLLYTSEVDMEVVDQRRVLLLKRWYWPCVFALAIVITLLFL